MSSKNEFFSLLNNALFKEETDIIEDNITDHDVYMLLRYASFYHPNIVNYINNINKKIKSVNLEDPGKYFFQVIKSSLPQLNKAYIPYISKKQLSTKDNLKKFVPEYSYQHNISEAKVWDMLKLVNEIEKQNG